MNAGRVMSPPSSSTSADTSAKLPMVPAISASSTPSQRKVEASLRMVTVSLVACLSSLSMTLLVRASASGRGMRLKAGGARSNPRTLVTTAAATLPWAISRSKRRTQPVYLVDRSISSPGS
jgi:hypothetical protein